MLQDFYRSGQVPISFELFPPKTSAGQQKLYRHVERLMAYRPHFITCTYGAGGSTQNKTLEVVTEVKKRFEVSVASHLTVVGSTVEQLRSYLNSARDQGVDFIVALRGDPPAGEDRFQRTDGGLEYANELVALIESEYPEFGVIVAGYPEKHREAPSMEVDLENLKRKVDAGADVVVTQLFYSNDDFFRFQDECQKVGIRVPIVPGLLPVTSLKQVQRITTLCGATLPPEFVQRLSENDSPEWQFQVGVEQAIEQVRGLLAQEVSGLHFYILNQSGATIKILDQIELQTSATED